MPAFARARIGAAALALVLGACGGGSGGSDATSAPPVGSDDGPSTTDAAVPLPERCASPPLSMRLEAGGTRPAGGAAFAVSDAVARRVPILPGAEADRGDPAGMAQLEADAAKTNLALYTLYLADFEVPRTELSGAGLGEVEPGAGHTIGAVTIVPAREAGFAEGDRIDGAAPLEPEYDATTTFTPVGVTVYTDGDTTGQPYTDVAGTVEVVQLTEDQLCLAIDLELTNQGKLVYAAKGTVGAEVVRSADSFYFT